jgi:pimeloyl-ACP methyl ester carboxylesterase
MDRPMPAVAAGERFAKANGLTLCYETFGDPAHPSIVLIMGLGAQMIAWDAAFCALLADGGFHVVRFDNRDIGRSTHMTAAEVPNVMAMMGMAALGRMPAVPYLLADMAADTVGLMDALGIERAHIVGASMGGAIAQEIALRHAARVRSLTCVFSTTGAPGLPPPTPEAMAALLKAPPRDRETYIAQHRDTLRVLRGPHIPEDPATVERAGQLYDRGLNPAGVVRQLAAIIASGDRTARLADIAVPTLVIHGDADPLIRVEAGHAIVKAVGRATIDIIRGMGLGCVRTRSRGFGWLGPGQD